MTKNVQYTKTVKGRNYVYLNIKFVKALTGSYVYTGFLKSVYVL